MKILVIGDFHGSIPKNLNKIIEKNRIDIIVSPGDFSGGDFGEELLIYEEKICRKYGVIRDKWPTEVKRVADRKYEKWNRQAILNSEKVLKFFKKINKPFYFVHGNWDFLKDERKMLTIKRIGLDEIKYKNMFFIHRKSVKINGFTLIGFGGYRPSSLKKYLVGEFPKPRPTIKEISRIETKLTNQLKKLFKEKNNVIFVTHDPPYKTKLDCLNTRHIGEIITRNIIENYQPLICVCGHMHDNQGIDKIGKTIIVNSGFGKIGEAALIDYPEGEKGKIKIKLAK